MGTPPIDPRQCQHASPPQVHVLTSLELPVITTASALVTVEPNPQFEDLEASRPKESSPAANMVRASTVEPKPRHLPAPSCLSIRDGRSQAADSLLLPARPPQANVQTAISSLHTGTRSLSNFPFDCNIALPDHSDPCLALKVFFASHNGQPRFSALCRQSGVWRSIMKPISPDSNVLDVAKFTAMFPEELRFRMERQPPQGLLIWMEIHERYRSPEFQLSPDLRQVLQDAHGLLIAYSTLSTTPLPTIYQFALQYFKTRILISTALRRLRMPIHRSALHQQDN